MHRGTLKGKQLFVALILILALIVPVGPTSQAWSRQATSESATLNLEAPAQLSDESPPPFR